MISLLWSIYIVGVVISFFIFDRIDMENEIKELPINMQFSLEFNPWIKDLVMLIMALFFPIVWLYAICSKG